MTLTRSRPCVDVASSSQSRPHRVWVTGGYLLGPIASDGPFLPLSPLDPSAVLGPERTRRLDPLSQYALLAVERARANAGLVRPLSGERAPLEGVIVGSALGATVTSVRYAKRLVKAGPAGTNPIDFPDSIDGAPAAHVALDLGLCGPSLTFADGRESGVSALVFAARAIASGRATRMHVIVGDCIDELFREALVEEYQLSGSQYAEAVFALVLERAGLRAAPAGTLELQGFSGQNSHPGSEPDRADLASKLARQPENPQDLSGALELAGAWLGAIARSGNWGEVWQLPSVLASGGSEALREGTLASQAHPYLAFAPLPAREQV